jgi:hypothetical protein
MKSQSLKHTNRLWFYRRHLLIFALLSGLTAQVFAAPTLTTSQTWSVDENTANDTLLGQVIATGGDYTSTLPLDVGTQSVQNWSTRGEAYEAVNFNTAFSAAPIVLSQIQSDGDYMVIYSVSTSSYAGTETKSAYEILFRPRLQNTTASGFETILETDLYTGGSSSVDSIDIVSGSETVGWLAIGGAVQGAWSGLPFETALSAETVTEADSTINFSGPFYDTPQFMSSVATTNDSNQTGVGISNVTENKLQVYMDEIDDGDHLGEAVSTLVMQGSGSLSDVNGTVIGEAGTITRSDTDRDSAWTINLLNSYTNPVVFVQPLDLDDDMRDAVFRFTDISANSFSGYLHDDAENFSSERWDSFDLHYFVFEAGSWTVGVENYTYSIIDGNDSGAFAIDVDTGEIKVADSSQLDYESAVLQYTLTVEVADGTGVTGSTTVTVNIDNVTDSLNSDAQMLNGINANDRNGWSVASAGDVNGDGLADIIIGMPTNDTNGNNAGAAYVVFGDSSGTVADLTDILAGSGGFVINGESAGDEAGLAVSGGADVNGDGLADVVIGAPFADPNGTESGKAYVVFGKSDTATVELSDITLGTDSRGFVMNGTSEYDRAGGSLLLADVNGDGLADVVIGEPEKTTDDFYNFFGSKASDPNFAYVMFGKTDTGAVELADIADDANAGGFAIIPSGNRNVFIDFPWGNAIMPSGDINSDGLLDFIITSTIFNGDGNYLIFGKVGGDSINPGSGLKITTGISGTEFFGYHNGDWTFNTAPGFLTSPLGDINADGLNDIALLATDSGCCSEWSHPRAYVIFGTSDDSDIDLSVVETGSGGFVIYNDASNVSFADTDIIYGAVGGAGDINGDGYDDMLIGDPYATNENGRVYVVYGKSDTDAMYLSDIVSGNGGFYSDSNGSDALAYQLASAGDVNGDGIADMLLGAPFADPNNMASAGTVYFMPGKGDNITLWGTSAADTLTGSADADAMAAGQGNDTLNSNGGADVLYSGPGDDTIRISDADFIRIDGGTGTDTLEFDGAGITLDLTSAPERVRRIEIVDITGSGDNTLTFNKTISETTRIIVKGDSGDTVFSVNQQWTASNTTTVQDGVTYDIYAIGSAELWLQSGLSITINAAPNISAQTFSVEENTTGGTTIGTVVADAGDVGDSITAFSLLSGNEEGRFMLDNASGKLSISDSLSRLDYEAGASYALTVQVTDLFEVSSQAVISINVSNLSTITLDSDMLISDAHSIWGTNVIAALLGGSGATSETFSYTFDDVAGLPIDGPTIDLSMSGTFEGNIVLELDGGIMDATVPVNLSVSYPDEIQAGQLMELSIDLSLDSSAAFSVSSPAFLAEVQAALLNYDIKVKTDFPSAITTYVDNIDVDLVGNELEQTVSATGSSANADSSVSADNPLRLEAVIDISDWVDQALAYSPTWEGISLSETSGSKEVCKEGVFPLGDGGDLYYKYSYTTFNPYVNVNADLTQNFALELTPSGTLTLEDGTVHIFDLSNGLIFTPESSNDSNGDGIIAATLEVSLTPMFSNTTTLNSTLSHPITGAELHLKISEAICTDSGGYLLNDAGLVYVNEGAGPYLNIEPSLSYSYTLDTISFALTSNTYTQELAFDLCDDSSGENCAASTSNTSPTASNVSIVGDTQSGATLSGNYTYNDTEGDAESGSVMQWYQADLSTDENGNPVYTYTALAGETGSSYTIANSLGGAELAFCVTPSDSYSAGVETCSDTVSVLSSVITLTAGFNQALDLDGASQYAIIGVSGQLNPASGSFSAETWFKSEQPDASGGQSILHQQVGSGNKGRVWLGVRYGVLYTWLGGSLLGNTVLSTDTWHHAAVVYDQDSGILSLYLNGKLEASETRTMDSSDGDLVLGANKSLAANFFAGSLDETRVWAEARTQEQIQQDMGLSVSLADEPALALYYTYDNDSGTSLTDATGNFNGTLNHSINLTNSTERTLSFDGAGDYVEVLDHSDLEFAGNSFSVEAWVYADSNSATDYRNIVSKKQGGGTAVGWLLRFSKIDNSLKPTLFLADGSNALFVTDATAITEGYWYHLAGVVDRNSDTATLYVNGAAVASGSLSAISSVSSGIAMRIGIWSNNNNNNNDPWKGDIDEVRIWNTARSQTEVQDNMYTRLAGSESNLVAYYSFEDGAAADISGNGHDGTLYGNTTASYRGIPVFTSGSGDLSGALPDGNGSSFALDAQPTLGGVTLDSSTGVFSYSPTDSSTAGSDSFSYYVLDGSGGYSYSETVTLTLEGLSVGGGTGSSSVSAGDLLSRLQQNQTLADPGCTPQDYYILGEERLDLYNGMSYMMGLEMQQNPFNGVLELIVGDTQFGLQPISLFEGGDDSLNIGTESISLGADGEVLLTRPGLMDGCALQQLIGSYAINAEGLVQIAAGDAMYVAVPDWSANRVADAADGFVLATLPANPALPLAVLQFNDFNGTWQQTLFPALANREVVENFLGDFLEDLDNGKLSVELPNRPYHFIPDYLVTQTDNVTGVFSTESLGDANGDGLPDFALIYPDGKRQEVYGVQ